MVTKLNSTTTELPNAIIKTIAEARNVLVVSHVNPDGDAIGSSLAMANYLQSLGKQVVILSDSPTPSVYRFLQNSELIKHVEFYEKSIDVDTVVALECPGLDRMGLVKDKLSGDETIISIDHHLDSDEYGAINWIDTNYSSVGEMLWQLFKLANYKFDDSVAEQLYTAVMTDTGRFRFDNTSPRTMICASELIAAGAKPDKISREVYFRTKPSTLILQGLVLHDIRFIADNRICYISLTNEMLMEAKAEQFEAEGLIDYTIFGRGVQLGAMFKEADSNKTRVSLRSANDINVANIAKEYGGGGHIKAAGFDIDKGIVEAREIVLKRLTEAIDAS